MIIYSDSNDKKSTLLEWITTLLVNALVLVITGKIFKGFMIDSYWYAIMTAIVIMLLDKTLKPILKILTLPITVLSLGVLYPLTNVIILKIAGIIMGEHFIIEGWFVPFFISIFISIANIILDIIITRNVVGKK